VKNSLTLAATATAALALLAGCGSSHSSKSSSTHSASTSAPASSSGASTNSGASTGPGAYGQSGASTTSGGSGQAVALTSKHSKLGTILAAGPKKMTVYLFEADRGGQPACSGACAAAWPPVTGTASAVGGAHAADLGTITRADGTKQVTYKGHPLYYFVKDKDDGDAYGQGVKAFGASWYVLAPSGSKVDQS
jgi:predicted lipoprotein with Yx(FWY)xxD motif